MVNVVKNVKHNNVVEADREKIVLSSLRSQRVHSSQPHMLSVALRQATPPIFLLQCHLK